jgi:hypothetical protein
LRDFDQGRSLNPPEAARRCPLAHPAIATVLTGVRSAAEFEENERLFRHPIPDVTWQKLKSEGLPAGEAPVTAVQHPPESDWPVCLPASDYEAVKGILESLLGSPQGDTLRSSKRLKRQRYK